MASLFRIFSFSLPFAHPRYSLVPAFPLCLLSVRSSTVRLCTLLSQLFSQFSLHFHTSADTKKSPWAHKTLIAKPCA
nr:MAG TPA: hypothetical protein [Caudoviricetes sp.]